MARKKPCPLKSGELSADSTRFIEDLQRETDRGVALAGAAFLDDAVRALLIAAFIEGSTTAERLTDLSGPLGSFAARTDLAYCMGLIGKVMYQDLGLVRDIRNRFAHQHAPAEFEHPEVSQICDQLQIPQMIEGATRYVRPDSRGRFILAVVMLANQIMATGLGTKHAQRGMDFRFLPTLHVQGETAVDQG